MIINCQTPEHWERVQEEQHQCECGRTVGRSGKHRGPCKESDE